MASDKDSLQPIKSSEDIKNKIYTIRDVQVMFDSDLAEIYGYTTKNFNRQVKNNIEKFPSDMMFQLNQAEIEQLSRCKNFTSIMQTKGMKGGRTSFPFVFTEQGIYMLMTVLKGELATQQSLALVRMFKQMRQYIAEYELLSEHLTQIDIKLLEHDKAIGQVLKQLEEPREKKAVIFSGGQLWDATSCIEDIFKKAKKSITIIDKYVDNKTLDLLSKRNDGVCVVIVTDSSCATLTDTDVENFNKQYGKLEVLYYKKCHARYIILDNKILYHCGASIKDAGKQIFSIDQIDEPDILKFLKETVVEVKQRKNKT